jgi:nitric oxide reductase NorQ protein
MIDGKFIVSSLSGLSLRLGRASDLSHSASSGTSIDEAHGLKGEVKRVAMESQPREIEKYFVETEPYYLPTSNEVELFREAYLNQLPVLLKGPTGCGKTRFMEYMAWFLKRPLITVACHDDLTSGDLVGRYLIQGSDTVWVDGPLTRAVRVGGLCYLDEIVEARKDTTVVIHPLADDRRILTIEKRGEILMAPPEFMLIISFNPGYQSIMKDLKPSTRQRFISIEFDYPEAESEVEIVVQESGVEEENAKLLVKLGEMTRNLKEKGLDEGASTRLLVHAGKLIKSGIEPQEACKAAITNTLSDDMEMQVSMQEMVNSLF